MFKDISVLIITNLDWPNKLKAAIVCKQWENIVRQLKYNLFLLYVPSILIPEKLKLQKICGTYDIPNLFKQDEYTLVINCFIPYFENVKINKSVFNNTRKCRGEYFENYKQEFILDNVNITYIIVRHVFGIYRDAIKLNEGVFWTKNNTIFKTILNDIGRHYAFLKITIKNDIYYHADVSIENNELEKLFQSGRADQLIADIYYDLKPAPNNDQLAYIDADPGLTSSDLKSWLQEKKASAKVIEFIETLRNLQENTKN